MNNWIWITATNFISGLVGFVLGLLSKILFHEYKKWRSPNEKRIEWLRELYEKTIKLQESCEEAEQSILRPKMKANLKPLNKAVNEIREMVPPPDIVINDEIISLKNRLSEKITAFWEGVGKHHSVGKEIDKLSEINLVAKELEEEIKTVI